MRGCLLGGRIYSILFCSLQVAALRLTASADDADRMVALSSMDEALSTVHRAAQYEAAPQVAHSVPLTQDVHGERVVFKKGYGGAPDAA